MSKKLNLKELERKAWRSFFDDGLWDIYLGLLLASMGASRLLDGMDLTENWRMGIYIGLMLVIMVAFVLAKRYITVPRMGRVKFGKARKARKFKTALVLFASAVFGLVVMLVTSEVQRAALPEITWTVLIPAIWAVNMLVVFGAMGYLLDFERLYFIGLLYAIPVPLDSILRTAAEIRIGIWLFFVPSLLIVCVGVFYLVRFLRDYPIVTLHEQGQLGE